MTLNEWFALYVETVQKQRRPVPHAVINWKKKFPINTRATHKGR